MIDQTKEYGVYGDYGYVSQKLLFETDSTDDAISWAESYTKNGDMGGYHVIEVAFFAADGAYKTIWRLENEGLLYDEF